MSTTQIVWLVVGAIVVLALLSLVVMWMRSRNKTANKHAAERLRARADEHADLLPDADPASDADADSDDLQDAHDSRRNGWHRR